MAKDKQKQRVKKVGTRTAAPVRLSGGSGFRYENAVLARFFLDMLAGSNSLGAEFGKIIRIDLQARDHGWLADDLAITCETKPGQSRSAGISIKSDRQITNSGFPADFVNIAWAQWWGTEASRSFKPGVDAIVLVTAELSTALKADWAALLSEILQTTPERMLARLTQHDGGRYQSSALQRALFASFAPPAALAADIEASETIELLHDIRVLDFDYNKPTTQDLVRALHDCQRILSSGDANEAKKLWDRLVGLADQKRPLGASVDFRDLYL